MKKNKFIASSIAEVIKKRRDALNIKLGYLDLLVRICIFAIVGWLLFTQVFLIAQAKGQGMFPSIKDGDLLISFRMQREYMQNDVVTYEVEGKRYTGRIAALETDVVTIDESGKLLVNGTPQDGEILYPTYNTGELKYPYRVPEGCAFIMGDYRTQTKDSRNFGSVPMKDIEGKVITILRRRSL